MDAQPNNGSRPFSSEELAQRWGVSAQHVRDLIAKGTLRHFRVGRLIRIPATAVREFEECPTTAPNYTAENSTQSGPMPEVKRNVSPYVPPCGMKQNAA
ncbi:MAG: excisionase family DNA-binding protein [Devosia sp.]|nr:excisionase family DNA-binding protein [Devosia sp.]